MNYHVWVVPTGLQTQAALCQIPRPVKTFLLPFVLRFPMTGPKLKAEEGPEFLFFLFTLDTFPVTPLLMSLHSAFSSKTSVPHNF